VYLPLAVSCRVLACFFITPYSSRMNNLHYLQDYLFSTAVQFPLSSCKILMASLNFKDVINVRGQI